MAVAFPQARSARGHGDVPVQSPRLCSRPFFSHLVCCHSLLRQPPSASGVRAGLFLRYTIPSADYAAGVHPLTEGVWMEFRSPGCVHICNCEASCKVGLSWVGAMGPEQIAYVIFFFLWLCCEVCGILVPQPGIEPMLPAVEAQSPKHWTAREFPGTWAV